MRVPSLVIPGEYNFLVNPAHLYFSQVHIQSVTPFSFDERTFGKALRP